MTDAALQQWAGEYVPLWMAVTSIGAGRGEYIPLWIGVTSTDASLLRALKWHVPSKPRKNASPCCRWR
jgi:hypothetical protein